MIVLSPRERSEALVRFLRIAEEEVVRIHWLITDHQ